MAPDALLLNNALFILCRQMLYLSGMCCNSLTHSHIHFQWKSSTCVNPQVSIEYVFGNNTVSGKSVTLISWCILQHTHNLFISAIANIKWMLMCALSTLCCESMAIVEILMIVYERDLFTYSYRCFVKPTFHTPSIHFNSVHQTNNHAAQLSSTIIAYIHTSMRCDTHTHTPFPSY